MKSRIGTIAVAVAITVLLLTIAGSVVVIKDKIDQKEEDLRSRELPRGSFIL